MKPHCRIFFGTFVMKICTKQDYSILLCLPFMYILFSAILIIPVMSSGGNCPSPTLVLVLILNSFIAFLLVNYCLAMFFNDDWFKLDFYLQVFICSLTHYFLIMVLYFSDINVISGNDYFYCEIDSSALSASVTAQISLFAFGLFIFVVFILPPLFIVLSDKRLSIKKPSSILALPKA